MFFLSEPGSKWLASKINRSPPDTLVVGRIVHLEGSLKHIIDGQVTEATAPLAGPFDIHDGERVEVEKDARALLILNSQDEFELGSLAAINLQLWNPRDPSSAIYLNWMAGPVHHRKGGVRGKAYVVKDGRLYLPGQKPTQKALALTVLRSAPLDMQLAEVQSGSNDEFEAASDKDRENGTRSEESFGTEPETLANEYIDEMIATRQTQFQNCWLTRLKEDPNLKGKIVVQFEISRRGKVRDVRINEATLNDDTLKKCIVQVIERIPFRSFKGPEISLTYPIAFE